MNNKVKENLSFFQVRKGINDTIWLSRQADIINNHICASDNNQYSNSYQFKNNDGYPNGFIGVWRWSIQPEKCRSRTYTFIPEITGIEIYCPKKYNTIAELVNKMKTGIELSFQTEQVLLAIHRGNEYKALLVNYTDFYVHSNGFYMLKRDITKIPVYAFSSNSVIVIRGRLFYKSIKMDIGVERYEILKHLNNAEHYDKQPYEIVKNLFIERITSAASTNEGYTKNDYDMIRNFIFNMNSTSLVDDVQNSIENINHDKAQGYVNYFIKHIEEYIDGNSIEDAALVSFIGRNKKMFEVCISKVEENWKKENQKRINDLEEYSKQRTLEIDEEFKEKKETVELSLEETRQQNVELKKCNSQLQEDNEKLQVELKQNIAIMENTEREIKELKQEKEELNNIVEGIGDKIKQKVEESTKDLASFVSEYSFLNALFPSSQTIQVGAQDKSIISSFIPPRSLGEDSFIENDNWQDTIVLIYDALEDNGITKQTQNFASIMYACYWKKFPILFAGPYGELLANIISMAINGQTAAILDCSSEVSSQDIQLAKESEILLVKNCFSNSKKDYIIESLSNHNNFVMFTMPFGDELKIESIELMNYMLPVFTEDLFEEVPSNTYMKGKKNNKYSEFSPTESKFRLSKQTYKDTKISKLRYSIYSELLDLANQIAESQSSELEYYFILYPMIFMNDVEEKYIDAISTNSAISKDMKKLLLSKLGDKQ